MKLLICTQAIDKNHPILGFFHGWVEAFAQHFTEVHVICLQKGEYSLPPNVFVYSLGKESGQSRVKYLFNFYKLFGHIFYTVRVDYVFFHMGAMYNILAAPFFLMRHRYKTIFYWWKAHGTINQVGKLALLFVDRVYTSTESGFAIPTKKRFVVGQAIDVTCFTLPQRESVRTNEIIFVGRIMPVKRIEDFIDVAKILHTQNASLMFTIVGPVGDDAYNARIREKCRVLGLETVVQFVGPKTQTELVAIYQQSRIFLNTSTTHSMDKTVLEATLCGCIPVTGNRAFTALLEADGLYIANPTPELYASVIMRLLNQDNVALQEKLSAAVIAQHSLSTFTQRIFNIEYT